MSSGRLMRWLFWLLAAAPLTALAQPASATPGAVVAVGLDEYEALLEQGQPARWLPETALYEMVAATSSVRVHALLEGELRGPGPIELPVPGAGEARVTLDGHPTGLMPAAGGLASAVADGEGRHRVEVDFDVPVKTAGGNSSVAFSVPAVPSARAALTIPGRRRIGSASGALLDRAVQKDGATVAEFSLLGGKSFGVSWSASATEDSSAAPVQGMLQADALFAVAADALRARLVVQATARRADLAELVVRVPADWEVQSTRDADTARALGFKLTPGASAGERRLVVPTQDGRRSVRTWSVELGARLPPGTAHLKLPVPAIENAGAQRGYVAWLKPEGQRAGALATSGLTAIDPAELPEPLRPAPGEEVDALYRYAGVPAWLDLELKAAAGPKSTDLYAQELTALSFVGADGRVATWLRYRLVNEQWNTARFELPPRTELLCALEDGQPRPFGKTGNVAGVALKLTDSERTSDLELVTLTSGEPLTLLSAVSLALPTASMEVRAVDWDVSVPADHELRHAQGTLEPRAREAQPPESGESALASVLLGPAPRKAVTFERGLVAGKEPLALAAYVVSGGLVRELELGLFLLSLGLPLAALACGVKLASLPLALVPACAATLLASPLLAQPLRPLISGVLLVAALVASRLVAAGPEG